MPELLSRPMDYSPATSAAPGPVGDDPTAPRPSIWTWQAALLLAAGFAIVGSHAFVPIEEFVHRGDDAYYYFKVAAAYPRLGVWSFDGTQPTNGVQPLWAILLTAVAQVAYWLGITSPHVLDRIFIGFTALVQFGGAMGSYALLARQVSPGTGLAVAGAFLLPLGAVWGRVWGVESPLLALAFVATLSVHHTVFRVRPSPRTALLLGVLLGLTCLTRLNAGLLIPVLLAYHLATGKEPLAARLRHVVLAGLAATVIVAPYLAWNLLHTGHLLPVSGVAKTIGVQRAFAEHGITSRFSPEMLAFVHERWAEKLEWFVTSRLVDGLWVTGARLVHDGANSWRVATAVLVLGLTAPALFGGPRAWLRVLRARLALLAPFAFFAVYAVIDATTSILVYPTQTYAIPRWWLVSSELVLTTLSATIAVAALAHVGTRLLAAPRRVAITAVGLALLVAGHGWQHARTYWDGEVRFRDWNLSWNDESYRAAEWIRANVPPGELVGSWNAGVVAWYADRPIVNLDGLINNGELLPYLQRDRVDEYIRHRRIRYLSDMTSLVRAKTAGLELTEVYRHHSPLMDENYAIFRVEYPDSLAGERR